MPPDRKILSSAGEARAGIAAASSPQATKRKRTRIGALDPRQSNLLLPIRGSGLPADAAAPASALPPADAGFLPVDTLSYRTGLSAALDGEADAQIAQWARGDARAAKNWRRGVNGADAPALLNLAQPGRSPRVRAWLLRTIGAVEPVEAKKKGAA